VILAIIVLAVAVVIVAAGDAPALVVTAVAVGHPPAAGVAPGGSGRHERSHGGEKEKARDEVAEERVHQDPLSRTPQQLCALIGECVDSRNPPNPSLSGPRGVSASCN
jgi:hypothetical protein